MNREDFMKRLAELLSDVSPAERNEAIQYYNDYLDDAGIENEQSVIASLGSPEQLARTIKAGLSDGGSAGEFTEKGFSAYEQKKSDEVLDISKVHGGTGEQDFADSQNENRGWNQESAQNGNGGWNQENTQNGNNGWQQGNAQSENDSRQFGGQGDSEYYTSYDGNTSQTQSKKLSGGMIALIVVLCIFASPFLLGIGGGVLGIIVGIFGGLLGIIVGLGAAAIGLIVAGVCLFVYGIVLMFGMPLGGLATMGVGMILTAIGLLFLWFTVLICGMFIPFIIRGIVKLFNDIFHRGGAKA